LTLKDNMNATSLPTPRATKVGSRARCSALARRRICND
jgi:hypothetical protein